MSVYVDNARIPFGHMLMNHMVADTLDELHEMADQIGLKRQWFQDKVIPHYDVCVSKRELALKAGAKPVSARELIKIVKANRDNQTENN